MKKIAQNCGNCTFLDVKPGKNGKIRVSGLELYRCLAPLPEEPPLPTSCDRDLRWPPRKNCVWKDEGEHCPVWQLRSKPQ